MKRIFALIFFTLFLGSSFLFSKKVNRLSLDFLLNRIKYKIKYPNESIFTVSVKDIVECPKRSLNIAYFGQSNHGNNIEREKESKFVYENVFLYDWRFNICAKYKEPVAGADGRRNYGHVATDTINNLRQKYNYSEDITILGFSKGGSKAQDWAEGYLASKLDYILNKIQKRKIELDYVFWHQGESEKKNINKGYLNKYTKNMNTLFDKFLKESPNTYIGMALVSICKSKSNKLLIDSQKSIISNNKRILISINSDNLGDKYRYDSCHFNSLGANKIGEKYADFINQLNY